MSSAGGSTSNTTSWVQAANLKPGDEVVTAGGEPAVVVVAVRFTGQRATVYNFEVEGLHNYRVGSDGVVVHNSVCKIVWYHWITQSRKIQDWVRDRGIDNIEVYAGNVSEDLHRMMHGNHRRQQDYLMRWRRFMESRPDASIAEIGQFVEHLRGYY